MHVLREDPEMNRSLIGYIPDELWDTIKKQSLEEARETLLARKRDDAVITKYIDDFCDQVLSAGPEESYIKYEITLKMGHPVEKIIEYAEEGQYDLMVMAAHGHSMLEDAVLGTTTRRVLRRSTIPVLVVRTP